MFANDTQPIKRTVVVALVLLCAIVSVGFAATIFWDYDRVVYVQLKELTDMTIQQGSSETEGQIRFCISEIDKSTQHVVIQGWAFKNGEYMALVNNQILLRDTTNDTYMKISTEMVRRPDLDTVFGGEFSYHNGGFYSMVSKRHLKVGRTYEVCLLYKTNVKGDGVNNGVLVLSGFSFENSEV